MVILGVSQIPLLKSADRRLRFLREPWPARQAWGIRPWARHPTVMNEPLPQHHLPTWESGIRVIGQEHSPVALCGHMGLLV